MTNYSGNTADLIWEATDKHFCTMSITHAKCYKVFTFDNDGFQSEKLKFVSGL